MNKPAKPKKSGPIPRSESIDPARSKNYVKIRDLIRFRLDSSLRIHYLEDTFSELTGIDSAGLAGQAGNFLEFVCEDDRASIRNSVEGCSDGTGYFSERFRLNAKDGTPRWVWMRGPVEKTDDGFLIEGVISDISEEKRLQSAVQIEREFFQSFVDTLDDGICIISNDFKIKYMNRSLVSIVGNHVGEICYKALFDKEGCCSLPAGNDDEQDKSCGFREYQHRTSSPHFYQVRSLPITTPTGFKGRVGQFRDISKIKKLEHKFRDFAVRVRAIAKAADIADLGIFIIADYEGSEARFRFANQAFCRITGYNLDELQDMTLSQVIHPDDQQTAIDCYRRLLRGETLRDTYEIKLVRKDQMSITVFSMGALAIHHGRTAMVSFVRDITARKQLQESLYLSQRLASIGKLSAEIAHEINNPLTSILTFNKLLEKIIRQQPFPVERIPELQDYIRFVNNEAKRCAEIARNLLNFSRTPEIRIQENDLHEILEKTLGILRHRAEMSNISIVTDYSGEIPPVRCDYSRIQQAFINIFWNAIEAMPDGGILSVTTSFETQPQCSHLCKSGKNMVQVTIIDTGIGIPKENLDRIFEPFFSTKKEKSGVGLGLSVAYGIIRKHNGQILVQSEEGNGTCFMVQFLTDICVTCPFTEC